LSEVDNVKEWRGPEEDKWFGDLAGGKNEKKSNHEELSNLSGILRRVAW
jgi:hypothetical protein